MVVKISLKKEQLQVILAITFGNILEWFEVYSYAYLAPILSKVFFNFSSSLSNMIGFFVIFGAGFLARPFGAIIFGRIGDLVGRKKAFILSIVIMTVPTFFMGCLPTYAKWGICAPVFLGLLRLLQSIPTAGEAPGTVCFLYEYADPSNRRFMVSWLGFGNQIGAILGLVETFLMDRFMSEEFLVSWGWRISFWSAGVIGLLGILLRTRLHETPVFTRLKEQHRLDKETITEVIRNYKKNIAIATAFGFVNASTFYLIATYIPTYFDEILGLTFHQNVVVSFSILTLTTVLLPFFGILGDKFNNKLMLVLSCVLIIILLYPLSFSINNKKLVLMSIITFLYIIPITCITAIVAYSAIRLFPAPIRFTCFGLSFNLADGIIGGFTPALILLLTQYTNNQAAFCWFILICALVSLGSYMVIKE